MINDRFALSSTERKPRQFTLAPSFLAEFEGKQPAWGPVGYFTYKRCVDVSTPVLCDDLVWRPAGDLQVGQGIVGFDANVEGRGQFRHLRHGVILHNKVEKASTLGVELEDGTVIYATPDHGWLVKLSETDNRLYWKETKDLAETHKGGVVHLLRPFGPVWETDTSYEGGYIAAAYDGEGCLDRHNGVQFIQVQNEMLDQMREFMVQKDVPFTQSKRKKVEGRQQVFVLRTSGRQSFYRVLGRFQPQRLVARFIDRLKSKGGGALRTSPEDYVKVVRVFDAGERDIAVISTSTETHFTGGFASHNTYARPTCDCNDPHTCGHPTEEFWQTCQRVVEGVYNIQKVHCRRLSLPWNEPKAQRSAQEMFRRMWEFKFTPPGRGLAQMGAPFMWEKGGAALNNCFAPETRIIVEDDQPGIGSHIKLASLGDLAEFSRGERPVRVQTKTGIFKDAIARSFGVQKLVKVSFAPTGLRSNYRLEYDVTPNHRWLLADGSETTALKVGDKVAINPFGYVLFEATPEGTEGFTHGLVFGDGTQHTYYPERHHIRLCGEKDQKHIERLERSKYHFNTTHPESYNGDAVVWFKLDEGMNWKALPPKNSNVAYQRAFLHGWIAADGTHKPAGTICLNTQNHEAAQWLIERAPLLGFCVTGFNYDPVMETNYGPRSAPMVRITLTTETTEYTVKSITDEGREEEVFCVTEPETGTFTLEGGLVTGNCAFVSSERIDEDFAGPFTFLMDMSMLGVGVGGDTRGAGRAKMHKPRLSDEPYVVPDDREGWVALARTVLNSFVGKGSYPEVIDFSQVRPSGQRIRGFGGTASGPGPLAKLIKNIARTLTPKGVSVEFEESFDESGKIVRLQTVMRGKGKPYRITSGRITDIFNMIGACVVAGGVRRSAELMLGDKDDHEFRTLKDPTTLKPLDARMMTLQSNLLTAPEMARAGIQAEIDDLQTKIDLHPLRAFRWASNNSILGEVGMDYAEVGESIAKNGEPGIFWLKNAQDYGRMIDPPNFKDRKAQGCNPCITGDTIIFTGDGPRRADKMLDKPFHAIVDGKAYKCRTGVFQTGVKPVYLLQTKDGHSIRVTADHQILTASKVTAKKRYEVWVEAQDLVPGDKVVLNNVRELALPGPAPAGLDCEGLKQVHWEGMGTFDQGWLFGNLIGDGHFKADQETAKLQFWGPTKEVMLEKALQRIQALGGDPRYHQMRTGTEVEDRDMVSTSSRRLWEMASEFGIAHNKDIIGDRILLESSSFQAGFLRGLFDADGSVQGTQAKGVSIRLTSVNLQHLVIAQKMLMHFGINSTVYKNRHSEGPQEFPTGTYDCQARHELVIANDNIQVFANRIGFDDPGKAEKLTGLLDNYKRGLNRDRFVAEVESVTYVGIEPVYDCTVDEVHRFGANGITVHNCAEQTLESYELCCLVETYPAHHDDYEDFQRTLKFAYLYAKTVTLMGTHDPRTNAVMIRNKRIGCSMSGIRQAIEKLGRREFLNWCDTGYHYIDDLDQLYSDWLGVPRSIKTTSVKPSGCRPWYALTSTNKGLLTLEDLFENHPADQEWAKQPDHDLEAIGTGIISKTYNNGVSPVLRITTSYGIEVESTPNHQWWVKQRYDRKKSEKYQDVNEWRRADEIQPGDILDIQPGVYHMEGGVDLAPLNSLALNMRGDATEIQQPKRMNPRLAWLLGYLWGDGAMSPSKYRLRWVDARRENLEKAQAILKEQFGLDATIKQASEHRKAETLEVGSKHLWHWLIRNDVFKLYADKIDIIPKVVRASGQEEILAFLAGLLDADGWAGLTEQGAKLVWTTADEFFARHVQDVALAVGLVLGRSHITGGSSFQNRRSMYHLTQSAHVQKRGFDLLRRHSTKVAEVEARPDFTGWHCDQSEEMTSGRLILGKVIKVEPVGEMPTFDVEVHAHHWYYAGAVKSHNTVSLLCGATPGVHPPHSPYYIRNIRVNQHSPLLKAAREAGYKVEPDAYADHTFVISFPVKTENCSKGKQDVSIWEQVALAADLQRYWADNQVSVTVTFKPEEVKEIPTVLEVFEDRLKSISFLPLTDDHGYVQAPYIAITEEEFNAMQAKIRPMNLSATKNDQQDQFCDGEACQIDFKVD